MLSNEDIEKLSKTKPEASEYGLTKKDLNIIEGTDTDYSSVNLPSITRIIGIMLVWIVYFYILYYWYAQNGFEIFMIIMIMPVLLILPFPISILVSRIIAKIERRIRISKTTLEAYELWTTEKATNEKIYKEAFSEMDVKTDKFIKPWPKTDEILKIWHDIFNNPKLSGTHFLATDILPLTKDKMLRFFKHEIFRSLWNEDKDYHYFEMLKVNLVMNMPRFIKLNGEALLKERKFEFLQSIENAKAKGIPIEDSSILKKVQEIIDSEETLQFNKLLKNESKEAEQCSLWIKRIERLIEKTKLYDDDFFYISTDSDLI